MTAGIIVYNDHDTVLIDDNYSNLAIRASGTLSAAAGLRSVSLLSWDRPVIAVRSADYAGANSINGSSANVWSAGGAAVNWYQFDTPTQSSDYGFQVFNASGQLTFDALRQYARVRDVFSGVTSRTYDSSRQYAVAMIVPARRRRIETRPDTPPSTLVYVDIYDEAIVPRVSGATVDTAWKTIISAPGLTPQDPGTVPAGWSDDPASGVFAVLDVTGY